MANQDPQPEVYTTVHDFDVATASGTQNAVSIFTNQANNEEVRVYAVAVDFTLLDGSDNQLVSTTDPKFTMPSDFTMTLSVGPNNVPSNSFDIAWIYGQVDQTMSFTVPVIVLFQQPLQVTITANSGIAAFQYPSGTDVAKIRCKISLISELSIQKIAARRTA
tara:strand:+ start:2396 stop:2884 length:489 start_codon:yes stop_codon:yes gene_type:complete